MWSVQVLTVQDPDIPTHLQTGFFLRTTWEVEQGADKKLKFQPMVYIVT